MNPHDITVLPEPGIETRWFSPENPQGTRGAGGGANGGRKGSPCVPLRAGETVTLATLPESAGTVRRVWLTVDDRSLEVLRGVRVQAFWDNAETPAIDAPLGDFFGQMCGQMAAFESAFFASPEARSFVCTLPMPFRHGFRFLLSNLTDRDIAYLYYDVSVTIGETHPPSTGYIHAVARNETPTTLRRDYEILPEVQGRGRFLGAHIGVEPDAARYGKTWWGEGEVKIFLDGDTDFPTLCGTGTEDYIGTAWGQGRFAQLYSGAPLDNDVARCYGFYRWHIPDPVFFHESCRVTIQQIGHAFGGGLKWLQSRMEGDGDPVYAAGAGLTMANLGDAPASGVL
ncbi:MAG: DUF2961 domain-containing protein, partial [Armatimonadetes bacterium]|nr:DUF2961 domain-containing protein [Armatimonadota bacterium]